MKSKSFLCAAMALLLPLCIAWSDEPQSAKQSQPAKESQPAQSAPPADAQQGITATGDAANHFDAIARHFAIVDVSGSLVSANGLGIDVATPDAALLAQLGLTQGQGLVVTSVPEDSMGAKAGLKAHDIITRVDDVQISHADALNISLGGEDGRKVKLYVLRGGKPLELPATLRKPQLATVFLGGVLSRTAQAELITAATYRIGVTLAEADDTLRAHLRLAAGEGLVVTDVLAEGAASAAGIERHDVLVVLDGKRLTTVEAINAQIQEIQERSVELRLLRGGKEVTLSIAPRKTQESAAFHDAITVWDTRTCQRCHDNPHADQGNANVHWDKAHAHAAWRLAADKSVWTDGKTAKLYGRWIDAAQAQQAPTNAEQPQSAEGAAPQLQIDALKAQLEQMQRILSDLEAAIANPKPPVKEEKK